MATWKKVVVSGSNAQLASVTASVAFAVGTNQVITTSPSTTFLSGSFSGSFSGNGSSITGISYSNLSGLPSGIISASVLSSPLQGQALLTNNGVAGTTIDLGLEAGDTPTFAGINANGASFGLATSTATSIQIGDGSATVTIPGNFTVNGTTTIINTTNTVIKDKFLLLNSGSTANTVGGIVVGNSATNYVGEALYWENSGGSVSRWAIASTVDASSTSVTPAEYIVSAKTSAGAPSTAPTYGGSSTGYGNIYVDSSTGDVYIYS